MIGKTLGHYQILELLGEGGMGKVYRAEDTRLKRQVALKVLPDDVANDKDRLARFQQEARILASVDHPNIVTVHSVEDSGGVHFLTMQLVEGRRLGELIPDGGMSIDQFFDIAIPLADGLAAAHASGVIHRDLKPANIMVADDGLVKILDFGLAKPEFETTGPDHTELPTQPLTGEGLVLGTVPYMSPEQLDGKPADSRSDLFALGIVLYELATGQRPFKGDSPLSIASSIIRDTPEPAHRLRQHLPDELGRIISRCLDKDPSLRHQTAVDLRVELLRLREEPTTAIPLTAENMSLDQRRRTGTKIAALVAAAITVSVAVFVLTSGDTEPPTATEKKSIAVLPFENLTADAESDYFSTGITEDVLTMVGKIADLKVIPSVATRKYQGGQSTPAEIGDDLQVATLLTGSVRRSGDKLRITCRLVDTGSSTQMWAETYDRKIEDVFAIQTEIAQSIVDNLEAELSPEERIRFETQPTSSLSAYDLYLKGREFYYRYSKQDNEQAITMFQRAIEQDGDYALAYAGLADSYAQRAVRYGAAFSWVDEAQKTAEKAIDLNPNSAEAYKALGLAHIYQGQFRKGVDAYRRAIDLNPNYFSAVSNAGTIYIYLGMLDEAVRWLSKSAALNPLHSRTYENLGDAYRLLGIFDEAEKWLTTLDEGNYTLALLYIAQGEDTRAAERIKLMLAADPDNPLALERAGEIAHYIGDWNQAKKLYARSMANHEDIESNPYAQAPIGLGHILLREGALNEANAYLESAAKLRKTRIEGGNDEFYPRYDLAIISAIQGDTSAALEWLREAAASGWRDFRLARRDPWFDALHDNTEFQKIMSDVEHQVAEMRNRLTQGR